MSSSSFQRWAVALLLFLEASPGLLLLHAADYHPRFWIEGALGRGQNREQRVQFRNISIKELGAK